MISEEAHLSSPPTARGLSLQAALRSVGDQLEQLRVGQAVIRIAPEGIEVQTATKPPIRHYAWADLQVHAVAQHDLRTDVPVWGFTLAASTGLSWPGLL